MNKIISWFNKPLAKDIAKSDLEEAQRQFLIHDKAAAYHAKMREFYSASINNLAVYVSKNQ